MRSAVLIFGIVFAVGVGLVTLGVGERLFEIAVERRSAELIEE